MIHTIQNNHLKVSIKQVGAELCSLQKVDNPKEYIWQANPDVWGSHAPVLFPIIGALKDGKYIYNNKEYSLSKHGMIRNNPNMEVADKQDDSITFALKSSAETLKLYPFPFEFYLSYKLVENTLILSHKVVNKGSGEMYFSLGGHPAFNCPIDSENQLSGYYLEFEKNETAPKWLIDNNGLGTDETKDCLINSNILNLNKDSFNEDAIIFKEHKSNEVTLCNRHSGKILKVNYADFIYLGIWAKPNAPYVCIEPWLGITDHRHHNYDIMNKEGIIKLDSKKEHVADYSIVIY